MRELVPSAKWSNETHQLANLIDLIGDLFAEDYDHIKRPGEVAQFSTAAAVDASDYDALLRMFGGDE